MNLLWLCLIRDMQLPDAAEHYAKNGWTVFPVKPRGKVPANAHGHLEATCDVEIVRRWWRERPTCNVGIRPAPGTFVLDVDPRHGGDVELRRLEREHGPLPLTTRAITGSGGGHWWFTSDAEIVNAAGFAPGLDTRTHRGYVVAPPSVHESGGIYTWDSVIAPLPAPAWLVALVAKKEEPAPTPWEMEPIESADRPRRERYALAALRNLATKIASTSEGSRNAELNKSWWRMAGFRDVVSKEYARRVLLDAARAAGLNEKEALQVLR